MDETRKERLKRINPNNINPNGRYIRRDREGTVVDMTTLSVEDIRFLRWYHNNPNIAFNVQVPTTNRRPSANVETNKPVNRQVRVSRDQKYNKPKYRLKEPIRVVGKYVIIFGLVVCIGVASLSAILSPNKGGDTSPGGAYVTMTDNPGYTSGSDYMNSPTAPSTPEVEDEEYVHQVERAEFIKILCNVFQVDYQTTYSKLVEMTDDFSDPEYLAGRHPLVSCKGMSIDADSEEEFLVYAVRVIAQDPGRVDLSSSEVCIDNGYDSGTNYVEMIAKWAKVLDVDPALVYGIMRAETGFSSELFMESHNPGGLKDGTGNGFWVFPNKEAGIIELMMEIVKYQYKGANTIEEMAKIHCPVNDPEDTEGLNRNWVRNVTNGYEEGREIFEQMGYYESNGLSY